jgi:hypothetical protein
MRLCGVDDFIYLTEAEVKSHTELFLSSLHCESRFEWIKNMKRERNLEEREIGEW